MTLLWPRSGFLHTPLDYAVEIFNAKWLEDAAGILESGGELGAKRYGVVLCLRHLATHKALELLNKRSQRSTSTRNLNVAVHYLACKELLGAEKKAAGRVADAWGFTAIATVTDALRDNRTLARKELDLLANQMVSRGKAEWKTRHDALVALEADLSFRATNLSWSTVRKKSRKKVRRI